MSQFANVRLLNAEHTLRPILDYQQLTVTTTATTLLSLYQTAAGVSDWPERFEGVELQVEGLVRFTCDGVTTPTSSLGFKLPADARVPFSEHEARKLQLISATGGNVLASFQMKVM